VSAIALDGAPRPYAWGSRTAIQRLLGRPEHGEPIAELWFGAHPDDPAVVPAHGTTLDALIEQNPTGLLGRAVAQRFGRLPFLLKVIAADKALSIQVHPTIAQAQAGFAREDAAGIARDAPNRNYRDANHKPELLCALTPFDALCGFRPADDTVALLDALDLPSLTRVRELLAGPDGLRAAFTYLLTLDDPTPLVDDVLRRAAEIPADDAQLGESLRAAYLAGTDFPGDVGVVLSLLLNPVRLEPGEAIYLGAGKVHAYLRGTGVEIMANSDNVLRCGLTPKHIDVPELLNVTDFSELAEPRWPAVDGGFEVPVPDFRLTRLEVDGSTGTADPGPRIVLSTSGQLRVGDVTVEPGHAAFVPAGEPATISGTGQAFVAGVGNDGAAADRAGHVGVGS
jgi:mannose-6-phosphate isomerase